MFYVQLNSIVFVPLRVRSDSLNEETDQRDLSHQHRKGNKQFIRGVLAVAALTLQYITTESTVYYTE